MKNRFSSLRWIAAFFVLFVVVFSSGGVAAPIDRPPEDRWVERFRAAGLAGDTEWIPMRDGTRLAATIAKPLFGDEFPTILIRTPYGRDELEIGGVLLPLSGYAVVMQDMRGRGDSEGQDRVFVDDGWGQNRDGYDTVEWIASQSWSNGKIGTWGPSALGIVQGLMAGANPPHLTCQVISYAASQGYGQAAYQGGVFRESLVNGWLSGQDSMHMLPLFRAHPTDDEFWDHYDIESSHPVMSAPALFMGGFYDCFLQGTINEFVGRQYNGGEGARGNNLLMLGPWTHVNESSQVQGQLAYPEKSTLSLLDQLDIVLDWFNYWLKGEDNGIMDEDPVQYFLMGDPLARFAPGNFWESAKTWPPPHNEATLYLGREGVLRPTTSDDNVQPTSISFDPSNPIPTVGGANLEIPAGPYNQLEIENRDDVVTFTTDVLGEPLEVVGRIRAVVYASCNLSDMDLSIRLSDVYTNGASVLVCDGILRSSLRDGFEEPVAVEPGTVYRHEVDLWSTALIFAANHRIRLTICNANYPRFALNPEYQNIGNEGYPAKLETLIYHDSTYQSALILPVTSPKPGKHPLLPIDTKVEDWEIR